MNTSSILESLRELKHWEEIATSLEKKLSELRERRIELRKRLSTLQERLAAMQRSTILEEEQLV